MTLKIKNTLRSIALAGLALLPSQLKAYEFDNIPDLHAQTSYVSGLISPMGLAVKESCRQDYLSLRSNNFTFGVWQNQFLGEKGVAERDFIGSYSFPLSKNFSGNVSFQYWDYPNGRFGNFNAVETAGIDYTGKVNINIGYAHLNENRVTKNGDRLVLKISKPFKLLDDKTKVTITPSIATSFVNDYLGHSGISQATAGINLGISRGRFSLNAFANMQKSLEGNIDTLIWYGVGVGYDL